MCKYNQADDFETESADICKPLLLNSPSTCEIEYNYKYIDGGFEVINHNTWLSPNDDICLSFFHLGPYSML
jgi:hypothetical protein